MSGEIEGAVPGVWWGNDPRSPIGASFVDCKQSALRLGEVNSKNAR